MRFWTVKTAKTMRWEGQAIDNCLEERTFSVKAETYEAAVAEVLKFGAGEVIAKADITYISAS
jgi:hypothetical protein